MINFFSPQNAREASEILRTCRKLKAEGRTVAVGVLESPFKPAAWITATQSMSQELTIDSMGPSDEALVILSHARMNKIREISKSDLLAVVEGGVTFGAFIQEAAKAGLYFPHEPDALMRGVTIAELIMDGTIFATEGRFGGLREYVLSLEIVTPAGEIIKTGSRAVKDVAGYDVTGLVLGSGGLCGMVSSVTFRLLTAPGTRLFFACLETPHVLRAALPSIHRDLNPVFMEIFGEKGTALLAGRFAEVGATAGRGEANAKGARGEAKPEASSSADEPQSAAHSKRLLIGELQASEANRETELLEKLREYLPSSEAVSSLEPPLVEEYRRYPLLALGSLDKGYSLLHLSYDETGATDTAVRSLNSMTLYPARFHFYSPYKVDNDGGPEGPRAFSCSREYDEYLMAVLGSALTSGMETGPSLLSQAVFSRGALEVLGWNNERLCRRRVALDELDLPAQKPSGASVIDGRAKQQEILNDIAERIFREFDPEGIMTR